MRRIWISPAWTYRKKASNRRWPSKPRSGYQNWISKNGSSQVLARHFRPNLTYSEKLSEPDWNRTGQASAPHLRRPRTSPKGLEGDLNQQKALPAIAISKFRYELKVITYESEVEGKIPKWKFIRSANSVQVLPSGSGWSAWVEEDGGQGPWCPSPRANPFR